MWFGHGEPLMKTKLLILEHQTIWDLVAGSCVVGPWWAENWLNTFQKPGDHPNFKKNALGVKRPFSELSESSGVFSEQLPEFKIPFSEYEIPFLEWHLTTCQYENHNSRSNSRSDSRNWWEATWTIFICPFILGAFFRELGWSPRARTFFFGSQEIWPTLEEQNAADLSRKQDQNLFFQDSQLIWPDSSKQTGCHGH